jgi:hypothetical protein
MATLNRTLASLLIVVGGALLTTVVTFSFAGGIFHPYYVSLLAPFVAALVGAGVGEMLPAPYGRASSMRSAAVIAPLAIGAGVVTELVVLGNLNGALSWAVSLVIVAGVGSVILLATRLSGTGRAAIVGVALAALMAAPATWAAETLGHATNGTFPAGGSVSASLDGPGGARGTGGGGLAGRGFGPPPGAGIMPGAQGGGFAPGATPGAQGTFGPGGAGGFGGSGAGGMFGGNGATLIAAINYAKAHGDGTIGVASQSTAAATILTSNANVAGLGSFSGRESSISARWIASEVRSGHLRWVLADTGAGARLPGDTRAGSQAAIGAVEKACRSVTVTTSGGTSFTMYDCQGRAGAILSAAQT